MGKEIQAMVSKKILLRSIDFLSLVVFRMIGAITSRPLLPCKISAWCPDAIGFDVKFHREAKDEELYKDAIVIDKCVICVSGKKIKLSRVDDVYNSVITSVVGTTNEHATFSYVDYDALLMYIESIKNPSDIHDILNFKLRNVHASSC
jgi:hypothetical protein